jgi:hypothetical protein
MRAGATGRGHRGQKWRGRPRLAGDSRAAGSGRGHIGGGEGAPGKKIGSGAHPISGTSRGGGGSVGRRGMMAVDGGGAGTVVVDDGALALHHGEGESEVRWGRD